MSITVPMELFNEKFKKMTSDAKLLYGALLGTEKTKDEENGEYLFFPCAKVQEMFGCCRGKVAKLFKELEKFGLIKRKRQGRGMFDCIYILDGIDEEESEISQKENISKDENSIINNTINLYNSICNSLDRFDLSSINRFIKSDILELNKEFDESELLELFSKAENSDFLKGKKGFKARFSWIIKLKNAKKILDGKYDNRTQEDFQHKGSFWTYLQRPDGYYDWDEIERRQQEKMFSGCFA